jgi:hypothetical protein
MLYVMHNICTYIEFDNADALTMLHNIPYLHTYVLHIKSPDLKLESEVAKLGRLRK